MTTTPQSVETESPVLEAAPVRPEQRVYAFVLDLGMKLSLGLLLLTFGIYLGGVMSPYVPMDQLPNYWHLPAREFVQQTSTQTGWYWVRQIGRSDYLNYLGVAMLASVSGVCYLAILPMLIKRRDGIYIAIVLAEIAVMLLAASGLIGGGH